MESNTMNQNISEVYDRLHAANYRKRLAGAACFNARVNADAAVQRLAKAEQHYAQESAAVLELQAEIDASLAAATKHAAEIGLSPIIETQPKTTENDSNS